MIRPKKRCITFLLTGILCGITLSAHATGAQTNTPIMPHEGVSAVSLLRGIIGILGIMGIAFLLSKNKRRIHWKSISLALCTQIILAVGLLYIPVFQYIFEYLARIFIKVMDFSQVGVRFLLGDLADSQKVGHVFLFRMMPSIIFFAAITSMLYYLNILQLIVKGIGWCVKKAFHVSGAEGLVLGSCSFLGMAESPLLVKEYLPHVNRSQLFLIMSSGMATISGGIMAAYIGMLGGNDPVQQILYAKYLIAASIMAVPGVIVIAKIMIPQTEEITDKIDTKEQQKEGKNLLDAITNGTIQGTKIAITVSAILFVFLSLIALLNYLLGDVIGEYCGMNRWLSEVCNAPTKLSFQYIIGLVFTPITWLMGVCNGDILPVSSLLGTKIALNEFVAYADFSIMKNAGEFIQQKSIIITTFVLCGFANLGSVGIIIGGLSPLIPNRKEWITQMGIPCMVCGALVSCLSATIVGMIMG